MTAENRHVVFQPLPSYGKFGTTADIQYSWGIPRNVSFIGVMMDIDFNRLLAEAEDADAQTKIDFVYQSGIQSSAKEHTVPEIILSTEDDPVYGISAMKALNIAATEGQGVFTITRDTIDKLAYITLDTDTRAELQGALLAGKKVIVHESPINAFGWRGTGYIIFDPETGSGAYKISSGTDGAFISGFFFGMVLMSFLIIIEESLVIGLSLGAIMVIPAVVLAIALVTAILVPLFKYHMKYYGNDPEAKACWVNGMGYGMAMVGFAGLGFSKKFVALIVSIFGAGIGGAFTGSHSDSAKCLR